MENTNITRSVAPTLASIRLGDAYLKVGHDGSSVKTCRTLLNNKGYEEIGTCHCAVVSFYGS